MTWTNKNSAIIRRATRQDLPRIVEIYNETIPSRTATADTEPVSVASRQTWFDAYGDERPLWVAVEDNVVGGWLSLQDLYGRPAYHITAEVSVYVAQDFQTRGIGRRLLEKAIDEAPSLGLMNLVGFVFGHNAANLHLLESLGFQRWGHLPRVTELDGVERDVVILGLRLGVQPGS